MAGPVQGIYLHITFPLTRCPSGGAWACTKLAYLYSFFYIPVPPSRLLEGRLGLRPEPTPLAVPRTSLPAARGPRSSHTSCRRPRDEWVIFSPAGAFVVEPAVLARTSTSLAPRGVASSLSRWSLSSHLPHVRRLSVPVPGGVLLLHALRRLQRRWAYACGHRCPTTLVNSWPFWPLRRLRGVPALRGLRLCGLLQPRLDHLCED